MPKNTRVGRCVGKLTRKYGYKGAIAICQKSTRQNYLTGKSIRKTIKRRNKKRSRRKKTKTKRRRKYRKLGK